MKEEREEDEATIEKWPPPNKCENALQIRADQGYKSVGFFDIRTVHRYLTNKTKVVFEMYIRIFYLPIVFHDSRCN